MNLPHIATYSPLRQRRINLRHKSIPLFLVVFPVHMQDLAVLADNDHVRIAVDAVCGGVSLVRVVGEGEVERGQRAGDGAKCFAWLDIAGDDLHVTLCCVRQAFRTGSSALQGPHHDAQNVTTSTLPANCVVSMSEKFHGGLRCVLIHLELNIPNNQNRLM